MATRSLVGGDLADQAVLEAAIEGSKPAPPHGTDRFDYLLATPWRYPPLCHGSRFGPRHEPSLFYGSGSSMTALSEAAYYRFVFLADMEVAPQTLGSRHTLFEANYRTERGLRLQAEPFQAWQAELTHPGATERPSDSGQPCAMPTSRPSNSPRRATRRVGTTLRW